MPRAAPVTSATRLLRSVLVDIQLSRPMPRRAFVLRGIAPSDSASLRRAEGRPLGHALSHALGRGRCCVPVLAVRANRQSFLSARSFPHVLCPREPREAGEGKGPSRACPQCAGGAHLPGGKRRGWPGPPPARRPPRPASEPYRPCFWLCPVAAPVNRGPAVTRPTRSGSGESGCLAPSQTHAFIGPLPPASAPPAA